MKSPITIPCGCGKQINLEVGGSALPEQAACANCGRVTHLIPPLGNIPTMLLMERAKYELARNDVTVCILLSALAVEAEMAYLFFKWKAIDSDKLPAEQTPQDREQWEDEWASMRSVGKRLENLSQLLTRKAFDEFARLKMNLLKPALAGHDSASSMKDCFLDQFFERRNRIAHYGEIDFERSVGEHCFSSATALLSLLRAMDGTRYGLTFPKR
jgi:hypothetical protein